MKRNNLLKLSTVVGLAAVLVASLFMSACAPAATGEKVVKFGLNWPFSGPYSGWAWVEHTTSEIWADDVNAAGGILVGGEYYMVEIKRYDNQFDPTVTLSTARKAIFDDGIMYLDFCPAEPGPIEDLLNEEQVYGQLAMPLGGEGIGPDFPYTFQTWPEYIEPTSVAFITATEVYPGLTKVAVLASDDYKGRAAVADAEEAAAQVGFTVDAAYAAPDATDFYSALTPLLEGDFDFIVNAAWGYGQGGLMVKQSRELGFDGYWIFMDTIDLVETGDVCGLEALEGTIVTPQAAVPFTDIGKRWAEEFVVRYGTLHYWGSYGYDSHMLVKLAMEEADSIMPEDVIEVIGDVEFNGINGVASFAGNKFTDGLPRYLKMLMAASVIRNGELVDVYQGYSGLWD